MEHRHLDTQRWSAAAVDSALDRGDLKDWRELFAGVQRQPELARLVLRVATGRPPDGASFLARALVRRLCPGLGGPTASECPPPDGPVP
ncbi:MAG TPA: hypothetical protein PKM73_12800 [Verrucomicrobiota bacterium]|nr:hypothetical protein [Verrucomicrobiota bacterium]HNU51606.1 hypothetical protein [Verrucomicrobiota bacterium]